MLINLPDFDDLKKAITEQYAVDETAAVTALLSGFSLTTFEQQAIARKAKDLVQNVREAKKQERGVDALMQEYDLSSDEGIALMCLAEALLRVPDKLTIDKLLADKIGTSNWSEHRGASDSLFVNAATWSLMLTGKIYSPFTQEKTLWSALAKLAGYGGGGLIRTAVKRGMAVLGSQFVMGRTIEEALQKSEGLEEKGYTYSYDMLGEAALTTEDAERYYESYVNAIHHIGKAAVYAHPNQNPGLSVKLSALHPRYELAKRTWAIKVLTEKLLHLALLAKRYQIGLTVDAEESYRLELSLEIFESVYQQDALAGWEGLGLAVQAYQKRAPAVIDWLAALGKHVGRRIMVRLVKGAYWDTEIKHAQVMGHAGYPVYTRKSSTDVSYLYCVKKLLAHQDVIYPQFATHNAHTVATILQVVAADTAFEFQCLHGMGLPLYNQVISKTAPERRCRIYAPVGAHEDLLAYLVRRLLENGANTSFVNRITDESEPIEKIIRDPVAYTQTLKQYPHPGIPLPESLYGASRQNSTGLNIGDYQTLSLLDTELNTWQKKLYHAKSSNQDKQVQAQEVFSPFNRSLLLGTVSNTPVTAVDFCMHEAKKAFTYWDQKGVTIRAECLDRLAKQFEQHQIELMALLMREAGKTLGDALAEVREAVDFCRYYAAQAREQLVTKTLTGPTGELNRLEMHGRGIILCISPWNFPLAIFVGQIVAAWVSGNAVIAKPAEQTPLVAARAVALMEAAGIDNHAVQLIFGRGKDIGAAFVAHEAINGVMFTGSTETAKHIQHVLAAKPGEIVPLIAETGGQNVMVVDSSALTEQVVIDVVQSAFGSAGQRCSALRVLYLQEEIADKTLRMLIGAMKTLCVGDPRQLATDVGPVIDQVARKRLQQHIEAMSQQATLHYQVPLPESCQQGHFIAPCVFELPSINLLKKEVFGPILHVVRYTAKRLDDVIDDVRKTGYGLTFGIHSRIGKTIEHLSSQVPVGNVYVNRNMIGAVVGVQPFGGCGLSGTGPKAGGPHYLPTLCHEKTISTDTTASGGNASLLSLQEGEECV